MLLNKKRKGLEIDRKVEKWRVKSRMDKEIYNETVEELRIRITACKLNRKELARHS